jgi:hypothetical protein
MTKAEIIKAEKTKLNGIYSKLETKTKKSVSSLVDEAAFMAASLFELREIINEKGYTEEYQNGANQSGIKKCSEVEIYNQLIKNYMSIIKQLTHIEKVIGSFIFVSDNTSSHILLSGCKLKHYCFSHR